MQGGWKVRWRRRTAHRDSSPALFPRARGDATLLKLRQLSQAVCGGQCGCLGRSETNFTGRSLREEGTEGCGVPSA
jgi:hypothetical protein